MSKKHVLRGLKRPKIAHDPKNRFFQSPIYRYPNPTTEKKDQTHVGTHILNLETTTQTRRLIHNSLKSLVNLDHSVDSSSELSNFFIHFIILGIRCLLFQFIFVASLGSDIWSI